MSWEKRETRNWPEKSLEKLLESKYPGCSSAVEAVQKQINLNKNNPAPLAIEEPPNPELAQMKEIINEVELMIKDFDIDFLSQSVRVALGKMPTTTIDEALAWKRAWAKALEGK